MEYTRTIRSYCEKHKGMIFDVQKMEKDFFCMIPYKTYLRILNRLEDEGLLASVSKGVYLIKADQEQDVDDAIMEYYVGDCSGMVVGHSLYNALGISKYVEETVEIYTSKIPQGKHKNVRKYHLTGVELFFSEGTKDVMCTLELLEKGRRIHDPDVSAYEKAILNGLQHYNKWIFERICSAIRYQYSTVSTFESLLRNSQNDDPCIEIYERHYGKQ